MRHTIGRPLISILEDIVAENKREEEWAEIESDDMFQNDPYVGGYDADEEAFCFSYFAEDREYWFQLTLDEVKSAVAGELTDLELVEADR